MSAAAVQDPLTDPHTLTGTQITAATTAAQALSVRTHRQAIEQENLVELWYYRDSAWNAWPSDIMPSTSKRNPIHIERQYRSPSTMTLLFGDAFGNITPENMNSPYNLNGASAYDPLLDEARKVLLRVGPKTYGNIASGITPTSTLAPSSGALASLTNGTLGNIASASTNYVQFAPASSASFDIKVDLGSAKTVRHSVIRFATKVGTCTLPASIQVAISPDDVDYTDVRSVVRPVSGDWNDDYTGRTIEVVHADIKDVKTTCRYVRFRITPTGAQTIFIDELAIYGGTSITYLGGNLFFGYVGDIGEVGPDGLVPVVAIDAQKRESDNNETMLTTQFSNQDTADIIYTILSSSAYWRGSAGAYDAPLGASEIGWSSGVSYTAFKWPVWQGQRNNILGYIQDLVHTTGWDYWADGNGVRQLSQCPYRQTLPDRILIADKDGNNDVRLCRRRRNGKDLRNVIDVSAGDPTQGAAITRTQHPSSIARYGRRTLEIEDAIASTSLIREKIGQYILRDYAWRVQSLTVAFQPDFDTGLKKVYAFRAPARPNLYPKAKTASGDNRLGELWVTDAVTDFISVGEWRGEAQLTAYKGTGPAAPTGLTATPRGGNPTIIDLAWTAPADVDVVSYNIYMSTPNDAAFPILPQHNTTGTTYAYTGLTNGIRYFFYVAAVSANGDEGTPSNIVFALAGGAAGDDSGWAITDLGAAWNQTTAPGSSSGFYEYEIFEDWTSPPVAYDGTLRSQSWYYGFKHAFFTFAIDAIPSNPTKPESWIYQDEWHAPRYPPGDGANWVRGVDGKLNWYLKFKSATSLSGHTIYFRVFTWQTTNGFGKEQAHPSNIVSIVLP